MISRADVFVQNLVPGAAERLGLDAATVRAALPRLIHCSISGYGDGGPYGAKKAYDLLVQCETGLVMSTGTPETPSKTGFSVADLSTGMYAYSGILAALYDRERTGAGATLRVAMLDALGELMMQPAYFSRYGGEPPRRTGARHPSISPYGPFRVADGAVFFGIQNEREWLAFCRLIMRRAGLAADPRFASNTDRVAHHDELTAVIEESFAGRTADEVSDALEAAGIASARLRTPEELTRHPQLRARDRWRTVEHAGRRDRRAAAARRGGRPGPRARPGAGARRAHHGDPCGVRGLDFARHAWEGSRTYCDIGKGDGRPWQRIFTPSTSAACCGSPGCWPRGRPQGGRASPRASCGRRRTAPRRRTSTVQRSAGIRVFTDGEVRRTNWMTGILESIGGMSSSRRPP